MWIMIFRKQQSLNSQAILLKLEEQRKTVFNTCINPVHAILTQEQNLMGIKQQE